MAPYLSDVWYREWSRWNPVLSAANQVRSVFIPPNGRVAMRPSSVRLQGQPQCSRRSISRGASSTNSSTASWSHSHAPPLMVS